MQFDYSVGEGGWAGIERIFPAPQDWTLYQEISFAFYGANSGRTIRFELLENRAPGSNLDTAERFEYRFADTLRGWRTFHISWTSFSRRSDWQPQGAPDDGFNRAAIWGMNFSPIDGYGIFRVDEIRLNAR
jgi:hypothetical protein